PVMLLLDHFFLSQSSTPPALHSFPTRRSSDLNLRSLLLQPPLRNKRVLAIDPGFRGGCKVAVLDEHGNLLDDAVIHPHARKPKRSEEHTSELQSLAYLVCRLLLEKKNNRNKNH